jgi:uncharacterized protein (TIGR03032 family)
MSQPPTPYTADKPKDQPKAEIKVEPIPPMPRLPDGTQPPKDGQPGEAPKNEPHPLRSIYSNNLPNLLKQLNIAVLVTTYQAGKVIMVREDNGSLNTHFRNFHRPTGVALLPDRMAVGAYSSIWRFDNIPEVGKKQTPPNDACYIARDIHFTGAIDAHEMAYGVDGLWVSNTAFSCLCQLDLNFSFVPRWKPPFITALLPEDRCHLNGLGMVAGKPKYVTMLGEFDTQQGWRATKTTGGLVMDIETNQAVFRGLCMPHSPRMYNDKLWFLESGAGRVCAGDVQTGKYETVAEVPGFTRGFDLYGRFAFVGLSQVRETATFGGLPLVERLKEATDRWSGVVIVDITNGQTVAFLRFEDAVQEIFAVQVMPGMRYPELINDDEKLLASSYRLP